MKKFIGITVIVIIAVIALFYRLPQAQNPADSPADDTSDWLTYSNADLGISFIYPPEWGEAQTDDGSIFFSQNTDVQIWPYTGSEAQTCETPRQIQPYRGYYAEGLGYCRLFEDGKGYMVEAVRMGTLPQAGGQQLTRHVFLKDFELYQSFPELDMTKVGAGGYLETILNRTAPSEILEKIDVFEQMMLTLEIK